MPSISSMITVAGHPVEDMHRFFIGDPFEEDCEHWEQWIVIATTEGKWEVQYTDDTGFHTAFSTLFADDYQDVLDICYNLDQAGFTEDIE